MDFIRCLRILEKEARPLICQQLHVFQEYEQYKLYTAI